MAQLHGNNAGKKLIQIDVSSDTVCPWCFVGKRNLDKAMDTSKDKFDFEVRWHPFVLNPSAPKDGVNKREFYQKRLGPQSERVLAQMTQVFRGLGLECDTSGRTGNTLDSLRLITFAGHQGFDKQHAFVEELCLGYFSQGKYIGDWGFLLEAAEKAGVEGAAKFLEDLNNGVKEELFPTTCAKHPIQYIYFSLVFSNMVVLAELVTPYDSMKVNEEPGKYSAHITGVPYYVINGKLKLNGS